ncbi:MAG: ABC transporter permease [Acidobacteria bacterium]|nr:ABC transporter permease [Acidobacteriota bacterium]
MKRPTTAERIFRILLRLLPFDFQREYGGEMEEVFRNQEERARKSGRVVARASLWIRTISGILKIAPREHFDVLRQDTRFAVRILLKSPGFSVAAVMTLALAIGANTAIYSVVEAVLLRPLPYQEPERLVMLWTEIPSQGVHEETTSYGNYEDWRARNRVFEDLAVFDPFSSTLAGDSVEDNPESISVARVSENFFRVMGIPPALGRTFSVDEQSERARVVVLSHAIWQKRFGASPGVIGRSTLLNGAPGRIIGVMPAGFKFPDADTHAWEPLTLFPDWDARRLQRGTDAWRVVGRLRPEATIEEAQHEMASVAEQLSSEHAENNGLGIRIVSLHHQVTGRDLRLGLWLLMGAVGFLLLIACSNVANLLLARAAGRKQELAIRASLGANRGRLIRQLFVESLVLTLVAAAVGLLVAVAGLRTILALANRIPRADEIAVNGTVITFTIFVAVASSIVFGIIPAFKAVGAEIRTVRRHFEKRLHGAFVVFQFALGVILLCGAGLLVRSLLALQSVDPGFRSDRVLITTLHAPSADDSQRTLFFNGVLERIRAVPNVESAGLIEDHFISSNPDALVSIEGTGDALSQAVRHQIAQESADAGYFETLRIPILAGSAFSGRELPNSSPSALINEVMARRFWPGRNPIGRRFKLAPAGSSAPWITVIGIVGNMRRQAFELEPIPQVFTSYAQFTSRSVNIVIRTEGDPAAAVDAVRSAIREVTRTVPLNPIVPLESRLDAWLQQRRFQTALLGVFAAIALLLAAIGIYGVMGYAVAQRRQEIGIRLALGSTAHGVLRMILRDGVRLALLGISVGLGAAWILSRAVANLLYGVTYHDPVTFAAMPGLLFVVAIAACYFPAIRAARTDPVEALRI